MRRCRRAHCMPELCELKSEQAEEQPAQRIFRWPARTRNGPRLLDRLQRTCFRKRDLFKRSVTMLTRSSNPSLTCARGLLNGHRPWCSQPGRASPIPAGAVDFSRHAEKLRSMRSSCSSVDRALEQLQSEEDHSVSGTQTLWSARSAVRGRIQIRDRGRRRMR